MKDTFYFSHDYNSRSNHKIKKLLVKYGMLGYGVFWSIVEDLYNNANALPMDTESIAYDLRVDENVIIWIIKESGLFIFDDDFFHSKSIQKRLDERDKKSQKARESAEARWNKKNKKNANALQSQSDSNAIKERKGKEKKGKDIKENKNTYKEFVKLTDKQYSKLLEDFGEEKLNACIEKLDNYIPNAKRKYKDHNRVLRDWVSDWYDKQNTSTKQNVFII